MGAVSSIHTAQLQDYQVVSVPRLKMWDSRELYLLLHDHVPQSIPQGVVLGLEFKRRRGVTCARELCGKIRQLHWDIGPAGFLPLVSADH